MKLDLFSRAWKFFGLGRGLSNDEAGPQYSGPISGGSNEANVPLTDERSMQISAVWSCARLITETVGSLPLHFFRQTSADKRVPLENIHPLWLLFNRRPNVFMNSQEFREAMTLQLVLWGNAYAYIEWIGNRPVSLLPLRPECVTPIRTISGIVYNYQTSKGVQSYAARSIMHLKGFGPDGIVGLSPLAYARQVLGITVAADTYAAKTFASGGRPTGVLMFDKFLNAKQREEMSTFYSNFSASPDNAGKPWTIEGGGKYEAISIPPDDMQMLQSRKFQLGEIARIFRVPSHLINDSEKATSWGSGIEQLNIGFLQYTLRPYLTRWEAVLKDTLLDPNDRDVVIPEHAVEGLLRADSAARSAFYSTMTQNGIYTRNEVRKLENLPPDPDGDDLTVQSNLTPLAKLGEEKPAPALPFGKPAVAIDPATMDN